MKHLPAVLLGAALLTLLAALVACGGGDKTPQLGNGPADDIHGVWNGTYTPSNTGQGGAFCMVIQQDGRALSGKIAFSGGSPVDITGAIAGNQLNLVWSGLSSASANPSATAGIELGGSLSGTDSNGGASGAWVAAGTGASGSWTAQQSGAANCS